jgi:hypothetical protein
MDVTLVSFGDDFTQLRHYQPCPTTPFSSYSTAGSCFVAFHRQGTEAALVEAFGLDSEGMIEACPIILPSDRHGKFNQLWFCEILTKLGKQSVRDLDGHLRHTVSILKQEFLDFGEQRTAEVVW